MPLSLEEIRANLADQHPVIRSGSVGEEVVLSNEERDALLDQWAQSSHASQFPLVPSSVTVYQLGQWLTEAQHSSITAALAAMPSATPEEQNAKFKARMAWLKATTIERTNPLVPVLASAIGLSTSAEIDAAFIEIAQIT